MGKDFDSDIVETIEKLKSCNDVQEALLLVQQQLPEIIEIQKELALIEAPTFHEEKKARRYAQLLVEAGLEEVKIGKELLFGIPVVKIHLPIFIVAQKSLDIRRDHAALVQAGDERSGEISIEQAGQMV